jgi:hypothetical protein
VCPTQFDFPIACAGSRGDCQGQGEQEQENNRREQQAALDFARRKLGILQDQ